MILHRWFVKLSNMTTFDKLDIFEAAEIFLNSAEHVQLLSENV